MERIQVTLKPRLSTDLDYDLHQYTSKGRIAGFEHHLDINLISTLKEKEETFRKLFLRP